MRVMSMILLIIGLIICGCQNITPYVDATQKSLYRIDDAVDKLLLLLPDIPDPARSLVETQLNIIRKETRKAIQILHALRKAIMESQLPIGIQNDILNIIHNTLKAVK